MRIIDLRRIEPGSIMTCDLCIVGSGPAGLTIASEFANTPYEVIVLESGNKSREDLFHRSLNEVEQLGDLPAVDQQRLRNRILGGTSHTWSGRCINLDPIDFEHRPWVPESGWPITSADLATFLKRAARYVGVVPPDGSDVMTGEARSPHGQAVGYSAALRPIMWQFSRGSSFTNDYVRFGPRFRKLSAPNIQVVTDATVTCISTTKEGNHANEVEVASSSGAIHHLRSRVFILCGGGIENARLLLASNRTDPRGVGNTNDLVGRFLMNHPRAVIGTFPSAAVPVIQAEFGLLDCGPAARVQRGLSLSLDVQRGEKLLNCAAWTTQHIGDDDVWRALRSMRRNYGSDRVERGKMVIRHADQIISGIWNKCVRGAPLPRKMKQLDVEVMVEQAPGRDSRITLSHRMDALGVPLSTIDWKIGEMERRTAVRLGNAIDEALAGAGLPIASLVDWVRDHRPEDAVFSDPAHPMGATRMSDSPQHGVVDRNCKVFGVDNLYVAGSSVFPTGGHANPTLTIVALALRLADTLRIEMRRKTVSHEKQL